MNILYRETKEVIRVLHKNQEEMKDNIEKLMKEGWSDNTRFSLSGTGIIREELRGDEIEEIKKKFPEAEIHYPEKNSLLRNLPYVYVTVHEREQVK